MALNYREVAGFKALIKAILEEIEDSDNFDGLWKSADAFDNAYNTAEYPISYPEDENGVEYEFDGHDLGLYQTEEEGGPPEPWVSQSEYFFKLASDHERVKSLWYGGDYTSDEHTLDHTHYTAHHETDAVEELKDVGSRARYWLDLGTIYTKIPKEDAPSGTTHIAMSQEDAAKRIEFLCQLLKMCLLIDDNDAGGSTNSDEFLMHGTNSQVSTTISDITYPEYYDSGATSGEEFLKRKGYAEFTFTSPSKDGRQMSSPTGEIDGWWTPSYPNPDDLSSHASSDIVSTAAHAASLGPGDRGLRDQEQYLNYERFVLNDSLNNTARPYLNHNGSVKLDNYSATHLLQNGEYVRSLNPGVRWEKWSCRVNFESFLLYASDLIELLDVYYAAKDWSGEIASGTKPVFFGGKKYMSYPKADSPDYDEDLQKLKDNNAGYSDMTVDLISNMLEEISNDDLLISTELKTWWLDFLNSYWSGELPEEVAGPPSSVTEGAPEAGSTIDITVCAPEEELPEGTCPDECVGDPNAFVPDWYLLDPDETFFNAKTCEYSVVVRLEEDNPYAIDDLTSVLRSGAEKLLKAYMKSEYIKVLETTDDPYGTGTAWSEAAGVFLQTITGEVGDVDSISTMDVIFDETGGTIIQARLGFLPTADDYPRIPETGIYVPDNNSLKPRVLVVIPAKLFDRIPIDYSSLKEIDPPDTGIEVRFLMADLPTGPFDFGVLDLGSNMVNDVYNAMRYYNVEYAKWASFKEEEGGDYGDLNLLDEAKKIKQFIKDLLVIIKSHGYYPYKRVEFIKIGFKEDMSGMTYLQINEHGCPPIYLKGADPEEEDVSKILWNFTGDNWSDRRTLAYIQRLPDMHNDVSAREPIEWNEFIVKYTVDLVDAAAIDKGMPTLDCEVLDESKAAKILGETLSDIFDFPSALADKFNKMACSGTPYERSEDVNYSELWAEVLKNAEEQGVKDFFAGDSAGEMLLSVIREEGKAMGPIELWRKVFQKYKFCGVISLLDLLLGCLLQGVSTADGIALLIEAAVRSLGPADLELLIPGLSPQQQSQIADQVSESLGMVFAAPPWENGYNIGSSWSSGDPNDPSQTAFGLAKEAGEGIHNGLPSTNTTGNPPLLDLSEGTPNHDYVSGLSDDEWKNWTTYVLSEKPDGFDYNGADMMAQLKVRGYETDFGSLIFPSSPGAGTIGTAAADVQDVIVEAYKEALLDGLSEEELISQLNALPGAELFITAFEAYSCNVPDYIDPPLGDFFKGLELDFCRLNKEFTYDPEFNVPEFPDFMGMLIDALKEMIIQLICTALVKILAYVIEMILNSLCKTLEGLGNLMSGDGFLDAFRDSFCDENLSDEEITAAVATLAANLSGCDPEKLKEDSTAFFADISLVLSQQELVDLFNGDANSSTLGAIVEIAELIYPDSFGACDGFSSKAGIAKTFNTLGAIVPDKYKKIPASTEDKPAVSSLCDDMMLWETVRCDLYSERGMTAEQCETHLNALRNKTKDEISQVADLMQGGLLDDLIPPITSNDPCAPSLFPAVDPILGSAASSMSEDMLEYISKAHRKDLMDNQDNRFVHGSGGLINMVMSSQGGYGFKRHLKDIQGGDDNEFPENVATHLKENYLKGGGFFDEASVGAGVETTSEVESITPVWGIDQPRDFEFRVDSKNLGEKYSVYSANIQDIERKKSDVVMYWGDYIGSDDDTSDFKLEYSSFDLDEDGKSIMNDYHRIRGSDIVNINSVSFATGNVFSNTNVPLFGFEGVQKTESQIRELVDLAEISGSNPLNLNIDEHLSAALSPRHSLYARFLIEAMKNMSPTAAESIDSDYDSIFQTYYDNCDSLLETYFKKFAERIADDSNPAFVHGFSTEYSEENDFDTGTEVPGIIFLDATFVNPKTGEPYPVDPEKYGGTADHPAFYMPQPAFDGWSRIMQIFAPESTGCTPNAKAGCDFKQLSKYHDNLYNTIVEDERLTQNPSCAIEHPWNKILDRSSTCGIEMTLLAVIRIYVAELFLSGMPSFTTFEAKFPSVYDDLLVDFIIDRMEYGLINQKDPGWFDEPNEYYFFFMEQIAQTYDRMYKRGEIEDETDAEREALDALLREQDKWAKEVAPELAMNSYPSLMTAGLLSAVGSPFGGPISGATSLIGALVNDRLARKKKANYWTSYIAEPNNLEHVRVLARRIVKQEISFVADAISEDMNPPISDIHDLFLTNSDMILGSLSGGGPWDVAKGAFVTSGHEQLLASPDPTTGELNAPYMLEKYIKVTDYDLTYIVDPASDPLPALESLSGEELQIVRRETDDLKHLRGVINIDDWEEYLSNNASLFAGKKVKDLWSSWEVGLRIVHIDSVSSVPAGVTQEEKLENKAFDVRFPSNGSYDSYTVLLIPLVSTEKESGTIDENNIEDITGSIGAIYASELACLVADLIKEPRYEMIFEYCIPLPKILSVLTIYVMNTFLLSVGSDEDWSDGTPGGKNFGIGNNGFHDWDKRTLFRRSKKIARSVFYGYYKATDLDWEVPKSNDTASGDWDGISWSLFWWLRNMQRHAVVDSDGNPC
tara:strand:- start:3325 stop:10926 length:7602 start_codon:yes stop_codon:yes gene_type:complete